MKFLKTDQGFISSRWIVKVRRVASGDFSIDYTTGHGVFDCTASPDDVATFLDQLGIEPSSIWEGPPSPSDVRGWAREVETGQAHHHHQFTKVNPAGGSVR